MNGYEYRITPLPSKALSRRHHGKGGDRYLETLAQEMNKAGQEGWDFNGIETVPCQSSISPFRRTERQSVLVFRRPLKALDQSLPSIAPATPRAIAQMPGTLQARDTDSVAPRRVRADQAPRTPRPVTRLVTQG